MLLYRAILILRHFAYDRGILKSFAPDVPTLCIGNLTAGGTGKTPFVEMTLRLTKGRMSVAVLSRGYGRRTKGYLEVHPEGTAAQFGDEPLQISRNFPDVTVAVCEDRVRGCEMLAGHDLVVLDDAMQHRRIRPSRTVCLVDFERPVWEDRLLPFGGLRDLPSRIAAADIIVMTKCPPNLTSGQRATVREHFPKGKTVLFATTAYLEPRPFAAQMPADEAEQTPAGNAGQTAGTSAASGENEHGGIAVMTGIARSGPFVRHFGERVRRSFVFRDHHDFSARELERVAEESGGLPVYTTAKDAARLAGRDIPEGLRRRLRVVPIQTRFVTQEDEKTFLEAISI